MTETNGRESGLFCARDPVGKGYSSMKNLERAVLPVGHYAPKWLTHEDNTITPPILLATIKRYRSELNYCTDISRFHLDCGNHRDGLDTLKKCKGLQKVLYMLEDTAKAIGFEVADND